LFVPGATVKSVGTFIFQFHGRAELLHCRLQLLSSPRLLISKREPQYTIFAQMTEISATTTNTIAVYLSADKLTILKLLAMSLGPGKSN
jgi:hypothetical protein